MSDIRKAVQSVGQKLVSGDKFRYRADGYDLDLTYILPRLIAMAIPGEGIEKNWRNNINEVSQFLNSKHGNTYRIFNLTGEPYDYSKFNGQVVDFYDFPDHHPPCLKRYLAVIKAIDEWMMLSQTNVAIVHCLAGRSRTGCVVAGYMMYSSINGTHTSPPALTTAKQAIEFFNFARSEEGLNIVLPSQIRWVNYFEKILTTKTLDLITNPPRYLLRSVRLDPPPLVEGDGKKAAITPITCVKYLAETAKDSRPPITEIVHPQLWRDDPITDMRINAEVSGDIEIIFYHNSKSPADFTKTMSNLHSKMQAIQLASKYPRVPLFRYIFNTSFLTSETVVLNPADLDAPLAGPLDMDNDYFSKNFQVTLKFEKLEGTTPTSVPILESSQISSKVTLVPTSVFKTQSGKGNIPPSTATMSAPPTIAIDPIKAALEAVALSTRGTPVLSTGSSMNTPLTSPVGFTSSQPFPVNSTQQLNPSPQPENPFSSHRLQSTPSIPPNVAPPQPAAPAVAISSAPSIHAQSAPHIAHGPSQLSHAPNQLPHAHPPVDTHIAPGMGLLAAVQGGTKKSPRSRSSSSGAPEPVLGTPIVDPNTNPFAHGHSTLSPSMNAPRKLSDPSRPLPTPPASAPQGHSPSASPRSPSPRPSAPTAHSAPHLTGAPTATSPNPATPTPQTAHVPYPMPNLDPTRQAAAPPQQPYPYYPYNYQSDPNAAYYGQGGYSYPPQAPYAPGYPTYPQAYPPAPDPAAYPSQYTYNGHYGYNSPPPQM